MLVGEIINANGILTLSNRQIVKAEHDEQLYKVGVALEEFNDTFLNSFLGKDKNKAFEVFKICGLGEAIKFCDLPWYTKNMFDELMKNYRKEFERCYKRTRRLR